MIGMTIFGSLTTISEESARISASEASAVWRAAGAQERAYASVGLPLEGKTYARFARADVRRLLGDRGEFYLSNYLMFDFPTLDFLITKAYKSVFILLLCRCKYI